MKAFQLQILVSMFYPNRKSGFAELARPVSMVTSRALSQTFPSERRALSMCWFSDGSLAYGGYPYV